MACSPSYNSVHFFDYTAITSIGIGGNNNHFHICVPILSFVFLFLISTFIKSVWESWWSKVFAFHHLRCTHFPFPSACFLFVFFPLAFTHQLSNAGSVLHLKSFTHNSHPREESYYQVQTEACFQQLSISNLTSWASHPWQISNWGYSPVSGLSQKLIEGCASLLDNTAEHVLLFSGCMVNQLRLLCCCWSWET